MPESPRPTHIPRRKYHYLYFDPGRHGWYRMITYDTFTYSTIPHCTYQWIIHSPFSPLSSTHGSKNAITYKVHMDLPRPMTTISQVSVLGSDLRSKSGVGQPDLSISWQTSRRAKTAHQPRRVSAAPQRTSFQGKKERTKKSLNCFLMDFNDLVSVTPLLVSSIMFPRSSWQREKQMG